MILFHYSFNKYSATISNIQNVHITYCVIPENTHTSPTEGIFSKTPHPSGNSNWGEYGYFLELHIME